MQHRIETGTMYEVKRVLMIGMKGRGWLLYT